MTYFNVNAITPEDQLLYKEKIGGLSREAQLVIQIIIWESLRDIKNVTLADIRAILSQCGWKWELIRTTIQEVRNYLHDKNRDGRSNRVPNLN